MNPFPRFSAVTSRGIAALVLAACALLSACGGGGADVWAMTPVSVTCHTTSRHNDGDTFRCATATDTFTVRLAAIDAPETGQAFAEEARQTLVSLTPSGTRVACYGTDGYGRQLCRVATPQGESVQAWMLYAGMAWYNSQYAHEQTMAEQVEFPALMAEARAARRGLWSDPLPQAPWDCRASRVCY